MLLIIKKKNDEGKKYEESSQKGANTRIKTHSFLSLLVCLFVYVSANLFWLKCHVESISGSGAEEKTLLKSKTKRKRKRENIENFKT